MAADLNTVSNYNIIKKLGDGAFGIVFLCTPMDNHDTRVAVKFNMGQAGKEDAINEYEVQAKFNHPGCSKVYGNLDVNAVLNYKGDIKHGVAFAMEFCAGGTVFDIVAYGGAFNEDLTRCYFR